MNDLLDPPKIAQTQKPDDLRPAPHAGGEADHQWQSIAGRKTEGSAGGGRTGEGIRGSASR